jgi:heme-dependent oxidative N-demethylase alpha subunit-like protein
VRDDKARYFPLEAQPLRMQPGLARFGSDFGNGQDDARFFPVDRDRARYRHEKAAVLARHPERFGWIDGDRERTALESVAGWILEQLARERSATPSVARTHEQHAPPERLDIARAYREIADEIAEDLVVLARDEGGRERVILAHVCFPSGWRPESIVGQSFAEIHAPVPEFESVARAAPALVGALLERGPYVRFVWGVSADDGLDHHPEHGPRAPWTPATVRGYLRVERQVMVPFAAVAAGLFLIRTYLYGFDELSVEQRLTLASALEQTSPAVLAYKGLGGDALPHVLHLLRR